MSSGSSTKPSAVRTMVSNAKFEVKKFDGTNNFGMWQCEVMDVLVQQELDIALEDKLEEMSTKDWEKINRQAVAPFVCVWSRIRSILLCERRRLKNCGRNWRTSI